MSYIQTVKDKKGVACAGYSYKPDCDPRTSKAFIPTKSYKKWCKNWIPDDDEFNENGFNMNNTRIERKEYNAYITNKFNVGMTTGIKYGSNILAVDVDDYKWKNREEHPWIMKFGEDYIKKFDTYTQRTPGGGFHLFFQYDERVGKSVNHKELEIDIKSNGGVITMAGSFNPIKNGFYTVEENTSQRIRKMPIELIIWINKFIYGEKKLKPTKPTSVGQSKNISQQEYKYDIPLDKFKTNVVDKLPIKYFRNYDYWLKFITACKYLGFIDLAKEKSKAHFDTKHGSFETDFMKNWNGIYKGNCNVIEILYKEVKSDDLVLYRYKPTPKNIVMADKTIYSEKLSNALDIGQEIANGDCYVIKSDTGTGKSYLARKVIKFLNETRDINFISIVSRIGLAKEQYKDLEGENLFVNYYKDLLFIEGMNVVSTVDSLMKFSRVQNWDKYFVFVDEINSLLKYIWLASHVRNKPDIIELLIKILTNCRGFIMADADVSDNVFDFINNIPRDNIHFIENTYKHNEEIEAIEVNSMNDIIEMINNEEEKFLVCCDIASIAEAIKIKIQDKHPDVELYTADNDIVDDFGTIKKLIISPKVIYGQDSTLDRNVYCIYRGGTIDSEAAKQQICRERKIKKVYIHFENLKIQSHNRKYETLKDCELKTRANTDIIVKIFGNTGYDPHLEELYLDLYTKFDYYRDCLNTNMRLHLFRILTHHGFIVKKQDKIIKPNISTREITELSREHREEIFTYDNEIVRDWIIKYMGRDKYEDKNYVESILYLFIEKLLPNVHTIHYYLKLFGRSEKSIEWINKMKPVLLDEFDNIDLEPLRPTEITDKLNFFGEKLRRSCMSQNAFNIGKINDNITTKFYFSQIFKNDLEYKIDPKTKEIIHNEKFSTDSMKNLFRTIMKHIIFKKCSEDTEGYGLKKDMYGLLNNIFPKLYYTKQVKGNRKKKEPSKQKYYFNDSKCLLPIVKDLFENSEETLIYDDTIFFQ